MPVTSDHASSRRMQPRRAVRALSAIALVAGIVAAGLATAPSAHADEGSISVGAAPSHALGDIDYAVYLPGGYESSNERYPTLYLLHGRGDTMAAWQHVSSELDTLIATGAIPPMIVVMPDAPWNDRGSWYTDSDYSGQASSGGGLAVETGLGDELVTHIDETYRTVPDRAARAVGGYSMGGAGALRLALAHQETFSAAIVLSPAVYVPQPPADSSVRDYGAYGVGDELFDEARFEQLSYPAALEAFDPTMPVHLYIAVGDDEWPNPDPAEAIHDLTMEATALYTAARRVPGITAELRVLDGGHDWDVWDPAFAEGIVDVAGYLRTSPTPEWEGELVGSAGDDRAGGVVAMPDGGSVLALAVADDLGDIDFEGGLDVVVQRRDDAGELLWSTQLATAGDDRAYGVVPGVDGGVLVAGYTRGDLDGEHEETQRDDAFVAAISADGDVQWITQVGDAEAADRIYAVTADGEGGAWLAGYTSGSLAGQSGGDKDAVLLHVDHTGEIDVIVQLGGAGEDKGQAVALGADGAVYLGGVAGAALPGAAPHGGLDAFVARIEPDGSVAWVSQFGSSDTDQVWGLVARQDGSVVAIGSTRGLVGDEAHGDHDILVRALDADGSAMWTTQAGTASDDRGVTGVLGTAGSIMVVGTTYGALGEPAGGVDVVAMTVDAAGVVGEVTQLGSIERDGADEWDDPNLFASPGSVWITGLTYGAPAGATPIGSGDVFVTVLPFAAAGGSTPGDPGDDPGGGTSDGSPAALPSTASEPSVGLAALAVLALVAGVVVLAGRSAVCTRRAR